MGDVVWIEQSVEEQSSEAPTSSALPSSIDVVDSCTVTSEGDNHAVKAPEPEQNTVIQNPTIVPETNTAQLHVVAEDADTTAQIEDKSTALSDDSSTLVEEVPQQKQELQNAEIPGNAEPVSKIRWAENDTVIGAETNQNEPKGAQESISSSTTNENKPPSETKLTTTQNSVPETSNNNVHNYPNGVNETDFQLDEYER
ncbi:hypothetical protein DdX_07868 [Ditylenchus destructor]|uniref:Uncharacterized protein n=1 Tax=Ditylenchus destructor TaxID=166010 RepID=A0AAD4N5D3_9BILA|nr:hypothetical protein DdX_07868 [Ditylenchus destructor]